VAQIEFIGVLANAHTSVAFLDFAPCRAVVWPYEKLVRFIAHQEGLPKWSVYPRVDMDFAVHRNRRSRVCVLEGFFEGPDDDEADSFWLKHKAEGTFVRQINRRVSLFRLFEPGHLELIAHYTFERRGRRTEPLGSSWFPGGIPENPLKVSPARARWLNRVIGQMPMQFSHEYLNLAVASLDRSYRETDHVLAFLMLMIGIEAIFNPGKQEVRFRLCRGLAILCGRSRGERRAIFSRAKDIYDRRSVLLHTGKQKIITATDVDFVRHHLRGAVIAAHSLGFSKDQLSTYLIEAGFSSAPFRHVHT
jgi:hypothetical protein